MNVFDIPILVQVTIFILGILFGGAIGWGAFGLLLVDIITPFWLQAAAWGNAQGGIIGTVTGFGLLIYFLFFHKPE